MNRNGIRFFSLLFVWFAFSLQAAEFERVSRSMKFFRNYIDFMNEPEIKTDAGPAVIYDMMFMSIQEEAQREGDDALTLSYVKNQIKLERFAKSVYKKEVTGIDRRFSKPKDRQSALKDAELRKAKLRNIDKIVFASIGSSSTQIYWKDKQRDTQTRFYNFGTNPSKNPETDEGAFNLLIATLSRLKRPVIFFNSVAFAVPEGIEVEPYHICNLYDDIRFKIQKTEKDGSIVDDYTGIMVNKLIDKITALNKFDAYVLKTENKAEKFHNKWTNSLAKQFFSKDQIGLMVDNGGSGFSVREVAGQELNEKIDYVEEYWGKGKDQFQQKDIVAEYAKGSAVTFVPTDPSPGPEAKLVHPILINNRKLMRDTVNRWRAENMERIKDQKELKVIVRQTGQLRELFFKYLQMLQELRAGERKEKPAAEKAIKTNIASTSTTAIHVQ